MTNLFQFGDFTLSNGVWSRLNLDCDAISPEEWHSLARIALPLVPAYERVIPVALASKGTLTWVEILENYIQPGSHRALIVDSVWVGPDAMRRAWASYGYGYWHGLVLFSRGLAHKEVTALFTVNEGLQ